MTRRIVLTAAVLLVSSGLTLLVSTLLGMSDFDAFTKAIVGFTLGTVIGIPMWLFIYGIWERR